MFVRRDVPLFWNEIIALVPINQPTQTLSSINVRNWGTDPDTTYPRIIIRQIKRNFGSGRKCDLEFNDFYLFYLLSFLKSLDNLWVKTLLPQIDALTSTHANRLFCWELVFHMERQGVLFVKRKPVRMSWPHRGWGCFWQQPRNYMLRIQQHKKKTRHWPEKKIPESVNGAADVYIISSSYVKQKYSYYFFLF